jgi:hypothetical protein
MKIRILVTAGAIIAGIAASCLALDDSTAAALNPVLALLSNVHAGLLPQAVSCNVNDEDKQAYCMRGCEEAYIAAAESYAESQEQRTSLRKDCEAKCGC